MSNTCDQFYCEDWVRDNFGRFVEYRPCKSGAINLLKQLIADTYDINIKSAKAILQMGQSTGIYMCDVCGIECHVLIKLTDHSVKIIMNLED